MKAITIYQPFASFIIAGEKTYETRGWATNHRGEIAIHAGVKLFDENSPEYRYFESLMDVSSLWPTRMNELPRGFLIGTAELVDCHKIDRDFYESLTERDRMTGDFAVGRYAWELANPRPFEQPIPIKGQQGLWMWRAPWEEQKTDIA